MTIGTKLFTMLSGAPVGADSQGNRYYRAKRTPKGRREKRWVVYAGATEASKVPPEWHSWLHYTTDAIPDEATARRWPWQKAHVANMTGTAQAYRPPGSLLDRGARPPATGDYEPWRPS